MSRPYAVLLWAVVVGLAACLAGCGSSTSKDKPKPKAEAGTKTKEKDASKSEPAGQTGHEGHKHGPGEADHADPAKKAAPEGKTGAIPPAVVKNLAQLSESDRTAAEKQRVCPVTDELLGSMGKPLKVTVKGVPVFLCCAGCEEDIKKDPDKYLAKLKTAAPK